ncbi:MAG TPA: hypothetical protein VK157_02905 [Phycisphaerales bacterium]|nr:hypothetical protein [Phycisphaerales bacterium]
MQRIVQCCVVVGCVMLGVVCSPVATAQTASTDAVTPEVPAWAGELPEPDAVMRAVSGESDLDTAAKQSAGLRHVAQLIRVLQAKPGPATEATQALLQRYEQARAAHDQAASAKFTEATFRTRVDAAMSDERFQLSVYERVFPAAWRESWLEPIVAQEKATLRSMQLRSFLQSTSSTALVIATAGGACVMVGVIGWIFTWRSTRQSPDDPMRLVGRRAGTLDFVTGIVAGDKRYTVIERTTTTTHHNNAPPTTSTSTTTTDHREFLLELGDGRRRSFHFTDFDVPMNAGETMTLVWPARKRFAEGGAGVMFAVNHTRDESYWRPSRVLKLLRAPQWPVWLTAIGCLAIPQIGWIVAISVLVVGIALQQIISRTRRRAFMQTAGRPIVARLKASALANTTPTIA